MAGNGGEYGDADRPGRRNVLVGTVAVVIVGALAAAVAWYVMNERQAERDATALATIERQIQLEEEAAERARLEADLAVVLAAQLEAKAAEEEAARLEAVRLAELAAAEQAVLEAELERQIAETKAALEREQAAVEAAAREAADERERILVEQERRRREAMAFEEALAIEIAFNMAREVNLFVSKWGRALDEQDYSLYRELGFRESESEFLQLYGDDWAEYRIAVLEKRQWEGGFVALRVTETYDPPGDGPGLESREIERRLVLRPTSSGMRYAGDRN